MKSDSLGLIETVGIVPAIVAADAASKAAQVSLLGYELGRAGLVTIKVVGDVAAVTAAVSAGSAAAEKVGKVLSVHVIPRPDRQLGIPRTGSDGPETTTGKVPPPEGKKPVKPPKTVKGEKIREDPDRPPLMDDRKGSGKPERGLPKSRKPAKRKKSKNRGEG